jgi:hypothetical protein
MKLTNIAMISVLFVSGCIPPPTDNSSIVRSLTGKSFTGKKYYFAWGHASPNDPQNMHNEVKYDVLHTHEIFTKEIGGSYAGTKLIKSGEENSIASSFNQLKSQVTANDMFIQYSSGHGLKTGLAVGGSYQEIASRILSLPAKEIIVFTMACHSGGLVDAFNQMRSQWNGFATQGRTLFVMSSSTLEQTSSTGPGNDAESVGPMGSAGSAFGHALWKSFLGDADGAYDGVKDGFIDLGEIESYTKQRTQQIGGHNPVTTGSYNPGLIMNQVPKDRSALTYVDRGTTNASTSELQNMIQAEDIRGNQSPIWLP